MAVDLISSDTIRALTGKLVRHDQNTDPKTLAGTFDVVFAVDAPKRYTIDVTVTAGDSNHVRLRCENWPKWTSGGEFVGKVAQTEYVDAQQQHFRQTGRGRSFSRAAVEVEHQFTLG